MKRAVLSLGLAVAFLGLHTLGLNFKDSGPGGGSSLFPAAQAQERGSCTRSCTLASLRGCYGYSYDGTVRGFGRVAAVGPINFDGTGNTSATYSVNLGGTHFEGSFTGTYTVAEDCSGTITINLPLLGTSSTGRFVILDNGREAPFMGTDPGIEVTGVAKKL